MPIAEIKPWQTTLLIKIRDIVVSRGYQPALGEYPIVSETALTGPFDAASQR